MMGTTETDEQPTTHTLASSDEMETLVLQEQDPLSSHSNSNYKSAMSTLLFSESSHNINNNNNHHDHPLSDPLFSPPNNNDNDETDNYSDLFLNGNGPVGPESPTEEQLSRSDTPTEYLKITVSSPQKETELTTNTISLPGGNTYVTYLITTTTNMPSFSGPQSHVRRRFRDIVTLSDRLAEAYRGYFIPARPDKSVVESQVMQKQEFVEQRRVALERYLRKLARHPVVRKSDELRVFLEVEGRMPLGTSIDVASRVLDGAVNLPRQLMGERRSGLEPSEVVQPAKSGRDLLRLFKELKQSVVNDWGRERAPVLEEDKEFLDRKDGLADFETRLTEASKQAETLVKAQQDMGDTMGELGMSLFKLTKFENQNAGFDAQKTRANDLKNVATATVQASRFHRELNAKTVKDLDTLHEYMGVMLAVRNAYADRASALLTVQTLMSDLSSLQLKAEKLEAASSKVFGADRSKNPKLEELKESIRITEDSKNCAVREYERIKENNRSELERIEKEKRADFLTMLKGFVGDQVSCAEKLANCWSKVAEDTRGYAKESL